MLLTCPLDPSTENYKLFCKGKDGNGGFEQWADFEIGTTQINGYARFSDGTASSPGITFFDDQDTGLFRVAGDEVGVSTGGTERMRVNPTGNVGINITSPSVRLHVGGDILATGEITANSDARLKKELRTIDNATEKLRYMRGYTFRRKREAEQEEDIDAVTRREVGLLAQEVMELIPEAVRTDPATGMHSIAYGNMVAVLIEAARETDARLQTQEREIADLKNIVKTLVHTRSE